MFFQGYWLTKETCVCWCNKKYTVEVMLHAEIKTNECCYNETYN